MTRPPGPVAPGSGGIVGRTTMSTGTGSEEEEQEDLNLLEVAVYGLASLYERFPPKKKDETTSPTGQPK